MVLFTWATTALSSASQYDKKGYVREAASAVTVRQPGASPLPHIGDLRSVSAVAETADAEAVAGVKFGDIVQQVQDAMWQPGVSPDQSILRRSRVDHLHVVASAFRVR
jgi:hypothetical protein